MQKESFLKRFVMPVAVVFLTMVFAGGIYKNSWLISHDGLRHAVAAIIAVPFFFSIGFGALVVYPLSFFKGASAGERIIASLVTPFLWNIKEMIRVSEFFPIGESIYFGLHQIFLLTYAGIFLQMGICEVVCRWKMNKQSEEKSRILSAMPICQLLVGMTGAYVFFLWGWGNNFYYIYIQIYTAIFT